jgi:hypothetical protein
MTGNTKLVYMATVQIPMVREDYAQAAAELIGRMVNRTFGYSVTAKVEPMMMQDPEAPTEAPEPPSPTVRKGTPRAPRRK